MIAYKFLSAGRKGPFTGFSWAVGEWTHAHGSIESGVYACRPNDLAYWVADELWRVELDGEIQTHESCVVATKARLVERIGAWDGKAALAFRHACVLHARDLVVASLRAKGHSEEAARLASAPDAKAIGEITSTLDPHEASGYLNDAAVRADDPTLSSVVAYGAGCAAAATEWNEDRYRDEKLWQSRWLVERIGI